MFGWILFIVIVCMLLTQGLQFIAPVVAIGTIAFGGYSAYKAYQKSDTANLVAALIFVVVGFWLLYQ